MKNKIKEIIMKLTQNKKINNSINYENVIIAIDRFSKKTNHKRNVSFTKTTKHSQNAKHNKLTLVYSA